MKPNKFFIETSEGLVQAKCGNCFFLKPDRKLKIFSETYYGNCTKLYYRYRMGNPTKTVDEIIRKSVDDICEEFSTERSKVNNTV